MGWVREETKETKTKKLVHNPNNKIEVNGSRVRIGKSQSCKREWECEFKPHRPGERKTENWEGKVRDIESVKRLGCKRERWNWLLNGISKQKHIMPCLKKIRTVLQIKKRTKKETRKGIVILQAETCYAKCDEHIKQKVLLLVKWEQHLLT